MTIALPVTPTALGIAVALFAMCGVAATAAAQVAVSANDNKLTLNDGVQSVVSNPPPDTVTVLDLSGAQPKVVGEVRVPTSIVGPPSSVAIVPDGSLAFVTAAQKIDPADRSRVIPDDTVSVIDLKASPPAVLATVRAGAGASGVSVNRTGTLALVANRMEGTVSVFTINGRTVVAAGKVDLGAPQSGPSAVVFTRGRPDRARHAQQRQLDFNPLGRRREGRIYASVTSAPDSSRTASRSPAMSPSSATSAPAPPAEESTSST